MADKQLTAEQIAKIVPNYKGKPEKFDPSKIRGRKARSQLQNIGVSTEAKASSSEKEANTTEKRKISMPQPTLINREQRPTAQKNETLISEAIFAPNVSVVPLEPRQTFSANYAALPRLALLMYREYVKDVKLIDRELIKEELSYYCTAMLWLRLINIKSKQGLQELTRAEKTLLKDLKDEVFNLPQPLYIYLMSIGAIVDKMGKRTFLSVPDLPTARAGGFGGYHANKVDTETHVLFEEVPSLGISGDMLMAAADRAEEPEQNFRVRFPAKSTFSEHLVGRYSLIGPRRSEIRQNLHTGQFKRNLHTGR